MEAINKTAEFNQKGLLAILRKVYFNSRKELKNLDSATVTLNSNKQVCNINIVSNDFNLSISMSEK